MKLKPLYKLLNFMLSLLLLASSLSIVVSAKTVNINNPSDLKKYLEDPTITTLIVDVIYQGPLSPYTATIRSDQTLIIKAGKRMSFSQSIKFINNGTFIIETGARIKKLNPDTTLSIENNGTMENNGTIDGPLENNGSYSGTGTTTKEITGNNVYAVNFDENYTGAAATVVNVYDKTLDGLMPIDPTRVDYVFKGWNTRADGSGTAIESTTQLNTLGSKTPTIYAKWISTMCDIKDFTLSNQVGNTSFSGTNIGITMPYGTKLTSLVPNITLLNNATVSPASGVAQDFTNPVSYTVTSEDGANTQIYTVKVDLETITKHSITLGTSGDGKVSGGGRFGENTAITVTATPNAGNVFVNWTENGIEVSTDTSYSFVVTINRTLVGNFKVDDVIPKPPKPPKPTIPSYERDSSYIEADMNSYIVSSVTERLFTKDEATMLFNMALELKPARQTTLDFKAQNYTKVEKDVLTELATLAKKSGVTVTVYFDTVVDRVVTYRVSINPTTTQGDLDLTAKIEGNIITLPKFSPAVEVAVEMPAGVFMKNLKITQNGKLNTKTKPWLDTKEYIHFTTTGGEIVLSN